MKIALIFPNNIYRAPYLNYYLQILDDHNIEYVIYNWDRAGKDEPNCISYRSKEESRKNWKMVWEFFNYRNFVKSEVTNQKYDSVIVFSCQIAILLSGFLIKNFKGKYLVDIRDYTKIIPVFKTRFRKVLKNAKAICISSQGFRSWLPKGFPFIISHNISSDRLIENYQKKSFFQNEKINVDTIGALRDPESNIKVVNALKNHPEFYLKFIGDGYAVPFLKKHIASENISNIHFHGYYQKEEEFDLLKNTDFINIMVEDNFLSKSLTSNRLYLCALLKIPAIVNTNTEQSRIIEKYGFGLVVYDYQKLPELLLEYRSGFNEENFISNCERFLNHVTEDQRIFESNVTAFFLKP
jgi:hypothetical protein